MKSIERDESGAPLGTCDRCFDGIRDATYFHPKANGCRNWRPMESMATPSNEGAKSPEEHFFDARAPFHWNKSDVLKIMREYRSEAMPAPPTIEGLFGRAIVLLKALNLAIKWELAPEIKQEIEAICTDFEKLLK